MDKIIQFQLSLNEIKKTDDPTILKCSFIILDFEKSLNNQIVSKQVALDAAKTLNNKPIVAKYYPVEEANSPTDALGSHEQHLSQDRYGNKQIQMDTVAIGVFVSDAYILKINTDNGEKEVLVCDALLWRSRYSDACDLLLEWYESGVNINTSCEFLYKNYTFVDGVEHILSPIYFEGHALLNSENRGEHSVVLPAYKSSKLLSFNEIEEFQRLVAQAVKNNKKEDDGLFRKVFELSHDDIRTKLYQAFDQTLNDGEYSYIPDVYDTYFIIEVMSETESKYFKIDYSKVDEEITIDSASKTEVVEDRKWVEKDSVEQLQSQLNDLTAKFQEATEKIVSLNTENEQLKPFKEQLKQEQYDKAFNEKKDYYIAKFEAINAKDKFETEEVQNLLKLSANDNQEGKEAIIQLNSLLIDFVQPIKSKDTFIKEYASKRENLLPEISNFDSKYSV